MAPTRTKKQGSTESSSSLKKHATFGSSDSPSTPQRSPIKRRKMGITLQQKQALIENLRLEITERARRLRAQYHLQAQGLRSRIEIRLNRIPTALRKVTMGDLLLKYADQAQRAPGRPLPLPVKDLPLLPSPQKPTHQTTRAPQVGRAQKRLSNEITMDKENELHIGEHPKKKARGSDAGLVRPGQVLSPTSSNSRLANRNRATSPTKSYLYKSSSPLKTGGSSRPTTASSLADKTAGTRAGGVRKVTTTSNSSTSSSATAARTKRTVAVAPKGPPSRPGTRMTRRTSDNDESSEGSANTVLRKAAGKGNATTSRKAVVGSAKKGVSGGVVKSTAKAGAAVSTSATGRTLRRRG
ncbi:Borealin N terminal domain-containing protein [Trichoderma ceciliae]